jgi:hypothetical protein
MKTLKIEWAVNLERVLQNPEKIRNRIGHIGIELEGGWDKEPLHNRVIRDGSVIIPGVNYVGEVVSDPIDISKSFKTAEEWIHKNYPNKVNETCGLHIHFSFQSLLNYVRVMPSEFSATIVKQAEIWALDNKLEKDHPIWARLLGLRNHCQLVHSAEDQILNTQKDYDRKRVGHRYSAVNYAYGRTGTAEIRVLSMMETPDKAVEIIKHMLLVVNAFLVATGKKEPDFTASAKASASKGIREVKEIFV